jgi:hypothetical protein
MTDEALTDFVTTWKKLPPLVRASVAAYLVGELDRCQKRAVQSYIADKEVMPRRARVSERFLMAYEAVRRLMVQLANEADAEAEAAGIDSDVRSEEGEAVLDFLRRAKREQEVHAKISWEAHRMGTEYAVATTAAREMAEEVDKELDELHSSSGLGEGGRGGVNDEKLGEVTRVAYRVMRRYGMTLGTEVPEEMSPPMKAKLVKITKHILQDPRRSSGQLHRKWHEMLKGKELPVPEAMVWMYKIVVLNMMNVQEEEEG